MQKYPNNPWGYIGWGDIFYLGRRKDFQRAHELYEKALATAKDRAIKERLEDLMEEM